MTLAHFTMARSALLFLLLTWSARSINGDFILGKLHPEGFDLPELNGHYYPGDAASTCDQHPQCAGFTYRGLLNFPEFPEKKCAHGLVVSKHLQ